MNPTYPTYNWNITQQVLAIAVLVMNQAWLITIYLYMQLYKCIYIHLSGGFLKWWYRRIIQIIAYDQWEKQCFGLPPFVRTLQADRN